jgi:hypothetical protein
MARVISDVQISDVRPKYDPPNGVDLRFGEPIVFEYKGERWAGYCQGWKLVDEKALVKTDLYEDSAFRVEVPVENVWRVRDSRDDRISELEKLAEYWMEKYKDLMYDRNQYKTLYESLHKAYVEKPSEE